MNGGWLDRLEMLPRVQQTRVGGKQKDPVQPCIKSELSQLPALAAGCSLVLYSYSCAQFNLSHGSIRRTATVRTPLDVRQPLLEMLWIEFLSPRGHALDARPAPCLNLMMQG